uniref:Uncharacterized protein n=1 Tax=Human betaherpesvirus 6 TaxID=10368 RepID=A0A5P9VHJ0_9BETA|nr:hypothetical protein [Human betaherpesvirus 6]QFX53668.1 hypothetical protein [Human betaherpesvirus 6]QFX53678.1 hypothetical protein [Human betaherpesvirus 6]
MGGTWEAALYTFGFRYRPVLRSRATCCQEGRILPACVRSWICGIWHLRKGDVRRRMSV